MQARWISLLMLCGASVARAATVSSAASGAWSDPAVWQGGSVPAGGDTVYIKDDDVSADGVSIALKNLALLQNVQGTLSIKHGTSFQVTNNLVVMDGALSVGAGAELIHSPAAGYAQVARDAGSSGTLSVSGGAVYSEHAMYIGTWAAVGATGTMVVTSGALVCDRQLIFGGASNSVAKLFVRGGTATFNFIDFDQGSRINPGGGSQIEEITVAGGDLILTTGNESGSLQFGEEPYSRLLFDSGTVTFQGVDTVADFNAFRGVFDAWVDGGFVVSESLSPPQLKAALFFNGADAVLSAGGTPLGARLRLAAEDGAVVVAAEGLSPSASNTLQVATDLSGGIWSNLSDCSASEFSSWLVDPGVVSQRFYRIQSESLPPGRKPNIIFLLADDLGYTDTGCYGSTFFETPNIDRLAREGMRFTQAYVDAPNCTPSRAAFLTGKHPARLSLTSVFGHRSPRYYSDHPLIEPEFNNTLNSFENPPVTLAELLRTNGYATAKFGKDGATPNPLDFGFDEFSHEFGATLKNASITKEDGSTWTYEEYLAAGTNEFGVYYPDLKTEMALDFIERNTNNPFFLYMPYHLVHEPILTRNHWLTDYYKTKIDPSGLQGNPTYGAMVTSLDWEVGCVLDKLDELGIADNTIVFFFSDNGPRLESGARAAYDIHSRNTSAAPLNGGKVSLFEGGIRVPLIVKWPGTVETGTVSQAVVSSLDFLPTIMEMSRSELPEGLLLDGRTLGPVLRRTDSTVRHADGSARDALYWHFPHWSTQFDVFTGAVRCRNYKLIESFETGETELYDLAADLSEQTDVSADNPELSARLSGMLTDWRARVGADLPLPATPENLETVKTFYTNGAYEAVWPPMVPDPGDYPDS